MSEPGSGPSPSDDDSLLVAYLDDQLADTERRALEIRLRREPALHVRLEQLKSIDMNIGPAFDTLLDHAPALRLEHSLDRILAGIPSARQTGTGYRWFAGIAAGLVLVAIGFGLGQLRPTDRDTAGNTFIADGHAEDWRNAIAEYAALYTPETFAKASDAATQAQELARLGTRLGLDLTPQRINLAGISYKTTQIFSYDGAVLGQIAFADESGAPILFCIIANAEKDFGIRQERRGALTSASWARDGRGYMLIEFFPLVLSLSKEAVRLAE